MYALMIRRLLTMALVGLLSGLGLYLVFRSRFQEGPRFAFAALASVLIAAAFGMGRNGIEGLAQRRLLADARRDVDRDAKRKIARQGSLIPSGEALFHPFAEGPLISINYAVTERDEHKTSATSASARGAQGESIRMAGFLAVPCLLRTAHGDVPLRAFPSPDAFPERLFPTKEVAGKILAHFQDPSLPKREVFSQGDALAVLDAIDQNSGEGFRHEFAQPDLPLAVEKTHSKLKVKAIPAAAEVCVVGTFDPELGGFLSCPDTGGISLYPGDAGTVGAAMLRKASGALALATAMTAFATLGLGALLAWDQPDEAALRERLRVALANQEATRVRALLARGVANDRASLDRLVDEASAAMMRILVEHGADLDRPREPGGLPPLIGAAMRGDGERGRDLVDAGASVDVRGGPGNLSALEWATDRGDTWFAQWLQAAGATGQVADQTALRHITEESPDGPWAVLRACYEEEGGTLAGAFPPGTPLRFEGGLGDGRIAVLRIGQGEDVRAHVMENTGKTWRLIRITPLEPPLQSLELF